MTPTPPSALLLAAAEAVARALDDGEFLESDVHRHELEAPILAALRPILEDRLARADAFDALEELTKNTQREDAWLLVTPWTAIDGDRERHGWGFCSSVTSDRRVFEADSLASAIAAARAPATPTKESEA